MDRRCVEPISSEPGRAGTLATKMASQPTSHASRLRDKVLSPEQAAARCEAARGLGQTVAQCHGCFDLVHPGHIRHLKQAAEQADVLLVSITPDGLVDKGDGRPLFPASLRAESLAAFSFVDMVCINTKATAEALLKLIQPDAYVKGREYETNDDPRFAAERRAVEEAGGRIVFTSGDLVFSSTALIGDLALRSIDHAEEDPARAALRRLRSLHELAKGSLEGILSRMHGLRVLVVGESIRDTYVFCDQPDVATDSPCLSLRPIDQVSFDGGAAVIAQHAAAMGAEAVLVTALPAGPEGQAFVERMRQRGVRVRGVRSDRTMLEKQRYLVGTSKVFKLELIKPITLDASQRERLLHEIASEATEPIDASIIVDFGNGLLTPRTLEELSSVLRPASAVLAGDVSGRRSSLLAMRSMDVVTPTEAELRDAVHDYESSLNAAVWRLMQRTGTQDVVTTMGDDGLIVFTRLDDAEQEGWRARVSGEHIPRLSPNPVDTLGCGNALLAATALARAVDASAVQAAYLGAIAASIESAMMGNRPVDASSMVQAVRGFSKDALRVYARPPAVQPNGASSD